MRKQTKIAAVVSAAALLALGASITSFAASKGTWMMVDGEWYCYDKNGDVYENTFCASAGKDYYVGDDGMLVRSSWVEYDGSYYFVSSSGAKITNDWRLTTPYDDDDADEEWYYFQSTGKRAENKKVVYKGHTYFFDAEGKMLTGWVTSNSTEVVNEENSVSTVSGNTTYYCDETGARLEKTWVYTTEPTAEDDEADADEYYYYLKSNGKVATGKTSSVNGQTFIFGEDDDNRGQMLTGWVGLATGSDATYRELGYEDSDEKLSADNFAAVYYCGYSDDGSEGDGHVKKNKWVKLWTPENFDEADEDVDKYWYWIEKDGKVFIPSESDAHGEKYSFGDAQLDPKGEVDIAKKKINSKDYFFELNGQMVAKFVEIDNDYTELAAGMYYFGGSDDGSMKTGSQSIKDDNGDTYKFYFGTKTTTAEKKGVGITGNKNNKLYYKGLLIKAEDYKYQVATINGYQFIVNQNGTIQHSALEYKEDGDTLINAKGYSFYKGNGAEDDAPAAYKYAVIGTVAGPEVGVNDIMPE